MEGAFILKQLHRNAGLYRACLIVFRVIMGCIALGGILNAFGILTIRLAIHEALIFLSVILQYKSFTRLKEATETAIIEMEKAQKTPGFRIPEDQVIAMQEHPDIHVAGRASPQIRKEISGKRVGNAYCQAAELLFGGFFRKPDHRGSSA